MSAPEGMSPDEREEFERRLHYENEDRRATQVPRDVRMAAALAAAGDLQAFVDALGTLERRVSLIECAFPEVADLTTDARLRVNNLQRKVLELGTAMHWITDRTSREED